MKLKALNRQLTICKVADIKSTDVGGKFLFVARTDKEVSLVCETDQVPAETIDRSDGWLGFRIEGQLDFSLIGILARISKVLADNQIGIFVVSTFDTDYILVKAENFQRALNTLRAADYEIVD